jgi:predicted dehydrogenase
MNPTRRSFVKQSALAATVAAAPHIARPEKAGKKIRVGFIGVGNRGTQLLHSFMKLEDVEVAALCDVYRPYVTRDYSQVDPRFIESVGNRIPKMGEEFPASCKRVEDYREVLADDSIDAVCIGTPDHLHAIQTIEACRAGKDVYVEKPLTITIEEGRRMIEVAEETKQVVAVGLNRRGAVVYQHLAEEVPKGLIGEVSVGLAGRVSNMFPDGIGKYKPETPPEGFNWDLWQGPRAERPFKFNLAHYKFRWWSDYSSQMGNWGVHYMDVTRWLMGEGAPSAITAHGSRKFIDDDADIPDTMEVLFEFDSGRIIKFSINEACGGAIIPNGEIALRGSKAVLEATHRGFQITPSRPGQFQTWEIEGEEKKVTAGDLLGDPKKKDNFTDTLTRNFIECVKSRGTPMCTLEKAHLSTSFAHLANIALARGKRLEWDGAKERFTNDDEANKLQHYDYRKPWSLG